MKRTKENNLNEKRKEFIQRASLRDSKTRYTLMIAKCVHKEGDKESINIG